jgi:hypothetical protein
VIEKAECHNPVRRLARGLITLLIPAVPVSSVADASVDPRSLEVDAPVFESRFLPASHVARFVFKASGQRSYLIRVDQENLDFVIGLKRPKGTESAYNSPLARDERELVLIEHAAAGDYRISLTSTELTEAEGRHAIQVNAIPVGTRPEYLAALLKMTAGAAAWAIDDWSAKERALEAYQGAVLHAERSGHPAEWAHALVYAIVVWLVFQISEIVVPALNLPDWVNSLVVVMGILGFPIAATLAWIFDLTPAGLVRDGGAPAAQQISPNRKRSDLVFDTVLVAAALAICAMLVLSSTDSLTLPLSEAKANSTSYQGFTEGEQPAATQPHCLDLLTQAR